MGLFVSIAMTTTTHSYHGYELALHHESDDRYRVTIFDPKGNRIAGLPRTWSDRALLLRRRAVSINFSRNDGPRSVNQLI